MRTTLDGLGKCLRRMINRSASNWVDRGEAPEPTLARILSSYLDLDPAAHAEALERHAAAVRGMAEADASEVQIAGYLRSAEHEHLADEHPARHRRGVAIALWHVTKAAEVRDRAQRLISEFAAETPERSQESLAAWLASKLTRDNPEPPSTP